VDVSEETQFTRTFNRDGGDPTIIKAIIASQTERNMRLRRADDILINERSKASLKREVIDLHNQYLKLAVIDE
jgi:dephospho-CoA kinase